MYKRISVSLVVVGLLLAVLVGYGMSGVQENDAGVQAAGLLLPNSVHITSTVAYPFSVYKTANATPGIAISGVANETGGKGIFGYAMAGVAIEAEGEDGMGLKASGEPAILVDHGDVQLSDFLVYGQENELTIAGDGQIEPAGTWQKIKSAFLVTTTDNESIYPADEAGTMLYLQNSGSYTITIKGPGAGLVACNVGDMVFGPADRAILMYDGSNWRCWNHYEHGN